MPKYKLIATIWLITIFLAGLITGKNIFEISDIEKINFNTNRGGVENKFVAKLVYNKFYIYINKYADNFFTGLDPNYFFFGGHPRETPGWKNEIKISYWLLPIFALGMWQILSKKEIGIFYVYGAVLLIASFFSIENISWFLLPFWYRIIMYPLDEIWRE